MSSSHIIALQTPLPQQQLLLLRTATVTERLGQPFHIEIAKAIREHGFTDFQDALTRRYLAGQDARARTSSSSGTE